jgi:hypothetical protein
VSPEAAAALISGAGLFLSLLGSAYISGRRDGRMDVRVAMLEASQEKLATREQLAGVKEDVAEIKGMFRMTLRDGAPGS